MRGTDTSKCNSHLFFGGLSSLCSERGELGV